jgi:ankyrin repeat protein
MTHCKATIKSLPIDVLIMIIEMLWLKEALRLCHALQVPEQVAVQYFYYEWNDFYKILHYMDLKPNSFKFLFKNKRFQTEANSDQKTSAALRTFDLEFVKNYLDEFKPDINEALSSAAWIGFTDAVKCLLADSRVDPSVEDNVALIYAASNGHTEIVKLLLSDSRVDPSADDNYALRYAARNGHVEIVNLLLSDSRVDPSAEYALEDAASNGHTEIVKLLLSDSRVDPSSWRNGALSNAACNGHTEIVNLLLSDSRVDPSAEDNEALEDAATNGHTEVVKLLLSDSRLEVSAEKIEFFLRSTAGEDVKKLLKSYLKKKKSKE